MTWREEIIGDTARGSALAADLLDRVREGKLDPRPAAFALGLGFDQDDITAILTAACRHED